MPDIRKAAEPQEKPRRVRPRDLDAIIAIDATLTGRSRRSYFERRLKSAQAEPEFHVQFAVDHGGEIAGYVLARKLGGEFGRSKPVFRLEAIGVRPAAQGHGIGSLLLRALENEARANQFDSIRTSASWRAHEMLRFLDGAGFVIGSDHILDCAVQRGRLSVDAGAEPFLGTSEYGNRAAEVDYRPDLTELGTLARDRVEVRVMGPDDVPDIRRIDRRITGRDRGPYIKRLVDEALNESAVRVSLIARVDGVVAGFAMARTDFGDFGRSEPVAVLDTIGVDPDYAHQGTGMALIGQLFANLEALRIEHVETLVRRDNFELLGFLYRAGFEPGQRIGFAKPIV